MNFIMDATHKHFNKAVSTRFYNISFNQISQKIHISILIFEWIVNVEALSDYREFFYVLYDFTQYIRLLLVTYDYVLFAIMSNNKADLINKLFINVLDS